MWVEFVVGSHPCSKGFSPGSPVFSSPQKPTFLNFQFNLDTVDIEPPCGCATANSHLFINFIFYKLFSDKVVPA